MDHPLPPHDADIEEAGTAFGRLASSYDEDFESLPAARRLRAIVWDIYTRHFHAGDSLLELNCGTGTDALALAGMGMRIHATDISEGMLDAFLRKLPVSPHRELVTMQRLAFDELSVLRDRVFDGVYSNMGGLNCEQDLPRVAGDLHALVRPGGFFIGTFLGDMAIWEMAAFLGRGRLRQAFRRRSRTAVQANIGGSLVPTFYHSPRAVAKHFSPYFSVMGILGLNIFTPPPTSQKAYRRLGRGMRALERLDDALMEIWPFNRVGDHFVIVLKHTGTP